MDNNQISNNSFYTLDDNTSHSLRKRALTYIKNNPHTTRKSVYKTFKMDSNAVGPRITELLQAEYVKITGTEQKGGTLICLKDVYNPEDFTSDQIKKRSLIKRGLSSKTQFLSQIGQVVVELFADTEKTNEDRLRFLNFLDKAINQFKKDFDKKKLDENIKLAKKVWGGTYEQNKQD